MDEVAEARVRCLVADCLGVDVEELVPEVSLIDDLAADSLDLLNVALALEAEFGIMVPERILDEVRTYGELVHSTLTLVHRRLTAEARAGEHPAPIWARIIPGVGQPGGVLERVGWLTPYVAQTIVADACRARGGARLEVTVAATTDDAALARVRDQFAGLAHRLARRDVRVDVRRGDWSDAAGAGAAGTVPGREAIVIRDEAAGEGGA
jgi:acyl carrier protein